MLKQLAPIAALHDKIVIVDIIIYLVQLDRVGMILRLDHHSEGVV